MNSKPMRMEQELTVLNKLGLHARAAAKLVTLASGFSSDIQLRRNERSVNGKSIMGVLMLAAAQGSHVTVLAEGEDAADALAAIAALFRDRFGEES